ncbi:MAG: 30S ribosomal protein S16 [Ichthyobacteriaceae bacterium]|nr:30S ribosomal protein S16 [Ichthyobacteriaceae bacterium]
MATRIRLQRHGRKAAPFFHIVVADSRSKRDGRFIEKLGIYNPMTNPATIELNLDSAVKWLLNGAEPSTTAKRLLSYKGAMLKKHLIEGIAKGALTEEQVEAKFAAWSTEKDAKISGKSEDLAKAKDAAEAAALANETAVSNKRAEAIAAKNTPEAPAEEASEEATEEAAE